MGYDMTDAINFIIDQQQKVDELIEAGNEMGSIISASIPSVEEDQPASEYLNAILAQWLQVSDPMEPMSEMAHLSKRDQREYYGYYGHIPCFDCNTPKPRNKFYINNGSKSGRQGICKVCDCERTRINTQDNRARKIEYQSNWREQNPEWVAEYSRLWIEKNPEKQKAHFLLTSAVRRGKVAKPDKCETCASSENIQGHHSDYTKPYDVNWLCASCHNKEHGRLRREAGITVC
jgi:hypothetical protein